MHPVYESLKSRSLSSLSSHSMLLFAVFQLDIIIALNNTVFKPLLHIPSAFAVSPETLLISGIMSCKSHGDKGFYLIFSFLYIPSV